MIWRLIPSNVDPAIPSYTNLLAEYALRAGRVVANTPIKPAAIFAGQPDIRTKFDYYITCPLDTIPLRGVDEIDHRRIVRVFSGLTKFNSKEPVFKEKEISALDVRFPAYSAAMKKWDQRRNKSVVAPRMHLEAALNIIATRLRNPQWVGISFDEEASFQKFCFDEIFFERQKGRHVTALRMAYALYVALRVEPESLGLTDQQKIITYRTLVAYMGGWAAYQHDNTVIERVFVHELIVLHALRPDLAVRNRIRTHFGYHRKQYRGPYLILRDFPGEKSSPLYRLYEKYLGDGEGGGILHNAARSALESGAEPNVGLRELGGLTAFTALQNAAKMDSEVNDMEGILFSWATLAEWSDRLGFENEFASVFASAEGLLTAHGTPLTRARFKKIEGTHHLNSWIRGGSREGFQLAVKSFEAAASIYDLIKLPDRAESTRMIPFGLAR